MHLDSVLLHDDLNDVPAAARHAEEIGFDAIWTAEYNHDPFLPLTLAAGHTKSVLLGTAIAIAFIRSPMVLAYTSWDLARQSGGRFILGLGTQVKAHVERRFGVAWEAPVPKMREYVLALRAIWDSWQNGVPLDFHGQYYNLTLMTPFFSPGPISVPRIPVYIAGVNTPLCRLAGEVGDGFHVHPLHSAKYLREIVMPAIQAGAAKTERSLAEFAMFGPVFAVTNDADREAVRARIAFYGSTPNYRPVLKCHGWGEVGERLSALVACGRWDDMPREVSDEMVETFAVVAKTADLPDRLIARYDGLLDRMHVWQPEGIRPVHTDSFWRGLAEALHAHKSAPRFAVPA